MLCDLPPRPGNFSTVSFKMYSFLVSSIFALVFSVTSCVLLVIHLANKKQTFNCAAWSAIVLGSAAAFSNVASIIIQQNFTSNGSDHQQSLWCENQAANSGISLPSEERSREVITGHLGQTILKRRLDIMTRYEWVAQPPKSTTSLRHPVEYVVISQTNTDPCTTRAECTLTMRYLQVFHVEGKKWLDIAYNFMVAGDGRAYEGRGWDVMGAHTFAEFNDISISISFVGTFSDTLPPAVQIRACRLLIEEGIRLGKISPNYKLIADRQVSNKENPGKAFYEELQKWDHWTPTA